MQLIFQGLLAVQNNFINDYIPRVPDIEQAYVHLPILRLYIPYSRHLEIIIISSLYIWTAITISQCITTIFLARRKCCLIIEPLKKIVNLSLILGVIFLVKTGTLFDYQKNFYYQHIVFERLAFAAFSLWSILLIIRKV